MEFQIILEDYNKYVEWYKEHMKECPIESAGAIGGRFTYSFTPIGLGVITRVTCVCGAELDLTDWESW